jgi:PAS domain S-box-containing protein
MNKLSTFNVKRKVGISVILGLLSLLFAPYGITSMMGDVMIDIPWSLLFPILVAMAFGWYYGVIAGVAGGALFPFLLWANNGWANLITSIIFVCIYILSGLLYDRSYFKKIKKLPFRILVIIIPSILLVSYYYIFQFNTILAFNPPFWKQDTIQKLPIDTLYSFAIKDSVNIIILILVSESLLKLPLICKMLGLPSDKKIQANNMIFIVSILTAFLIWLLFAGLSFALLNGTHTFYNEHITLSFLVILSSGVFVSRLLFSYSENQFITQSELNNSEKKYRDLFEANKDGITIFHISPDGKLSNFLEMNEAAGAMIGYSKLELSNMKASDLEIDNSDEKIKNRINELQLKGFSNFETIVKHKNGNNVPVEINVLMINYQNRPAMMNITRDISERKLAEQEIIKAKEKAEESDRLKSAFLANMSHEIRTPMNGILGFADLLKAPELSGEEQQAYIKIIEKSGKRMLNIINDIIDISKIEAGLIKIERKESNINEQIEYIYTFFKPEAETKKLKFSFNNALPAKEAVVTTDREKLYAILTNLVKNAIKYTHNGSIEFGYNLKKDNETDELEFYVKDTGIGIPKERHEAIFERFIQADISDKMAYQGAGLGLAISKAYVEMLGGKIRVESEEGEGSCFYFTLPYKTDPVLENIELQLASSATNEKVKNLKILIAEDDEVSEMLIDSLVKSFGKEILKARTGVEAIEICYDNPDIDLIMMDILMPVMGGYEATRKIREFNKTVIIIAQTAYALAGDRENAIASGCNDYISKPINKTELLALIQEHFKK